jgi:hypothetical protein
LPSPLPPLLPYRGEEEDGGAAEDRRRPSSGMELAAAPPLAKPGALSSKLRRPACARRMPRHQARSPEQTTRQAAQQMDGERMQMRQEDRGVDPEAALTAHLPDLHEAALVAGQRTRHHSQPRQQSHKLRRANQIRSKPQQAELL